VIWSQASPEIQESVLKLVREHYKPGSGGKKRGEVMRMLPFELRGVAHHAFSVVDLEALKARYGGPSQR
jgi:hypothetical protein